MAARNDSNGIMPKLMTNVVPLEKASNTHTHQTITRKELIHVVCKKGKIIIVCTPVGRAKMTKMR